MKHEIKTNNAPAAIGAYAQAIESQGFVFTSGQLGMDPKTGELEDDVLKQTQQVMKNIQAILKAAGSDLNQIVKTTIFLADINDFDTVNTVYKDFLKKDFPARSAFQVGHLPKDAAVEIEVIAHK